MPGELSIGSKADIPRVTQSKRVYVSRCTSLDIGTSWIWISSSVLWASLACELGESLREAPRTWGALLSTHWMDK